MNFNNLARSTTKLTLRERLLANICSASLPEFKRVPRLVGVDFNLNSDPNVVLALDLASKSIAESKAKA